MEDDNRLDVPMGVTPKRNCLPPLNSMTADPSKKSNAEMISSNELNPSASSLEKFTKGESSALQVGELSKQFDPLYSKGLNLQIRSKSDSESVTGVTEASNCLSKSMNADFAKAIKGKNMSTTSSEDTLISFVSPKKLPTPLLPKNLFVHDPKSHKRYSEKEFSHILKTQESRLQKEYEKKYKDFQDSCTEKDRQLEREISRVERLNKSYYTILLESNAILGSVKARNDEIESKTRLLQVENEKLKNDIKTTNEDCSSWETAFSEVHKRYEQCKGMNKSYKDNEELLMMNIKSARKSLEEKNRMYDVLDSRSREVKDQAAKLIETAKKSAKTEVSILETQLKKAELKAYTIEQDLKQSKLENESLCNIYDDLVSKIGK